MTGMNRGHYWAIVGNQNTHNFTGETMVLPTIPRLPTEIRFVAL
jgi:hypothetical protein